MKIIGRKSDARMVLVTCGTRKEARKIAETVVGKKLAACVNIVTAPVESTYRWKGKVERGRENLLVMKTTMDRLKELEEEVLDLHSYETPEFLVLKLEGGSAGYLQWIAASTAKGR